MDDCVLRTSKVARRGKARVSTWFNVMTINRGFERYDLADVVMDQTTYVSTDM